MLVHYDGNTILDQSPDAFFITVDPCCANYLVLYLHFWALYVIHTALSLCD